MESPGRQQPEGREVDEVRWVAPHEAPCLLTH